MSNLEVWSAVYSDCFPDISLPKFTDFPSTFEAVPLLIDDVNFTAQVRDEVRYMGFSFLL